MKSFYVLLVLAGFLFVSCENYTTKQFTPPSDRDTAGKNDEDISEEETDETAMQQTQQALFLRPHLFL